jgi:hypothetical protein
MPFSSVAIAPRRRSASERGSVLHVLVAIECQGGFGFEHPRLANAA